MRKLCMRSACPNNAVVLVAMDVKEVTFTVLDFGEVTGPGQVVLCETHVARLRAPKGWSLVDARTIGRLLPFPDRSDELVQSNHRTVPLGETIRSIDEARHPLDVKRSSPMDKPSEKETPLLARAFTGRRQNSSADSIDEDEANVIDPFGDELWDQSEPGNKEKDEQMEFESFDFEPSA